MLTWLFNRGKRRPDSNGSRDDRAVDKHEPTRVQVVASRTSWPVAFVWLFLSLGVTLASISSFVQPEWFVREEKSWEDNHKSLFSYNRPDLLYTLGLFGVCYRDPLASRRTWEQLSCYRFGSDTDLVFFPSSSWQMSCVLFGLGCALAIVSVVFALGSLWIDDWRRRRRLVYMIGYVQAMGVIVKAMSLLLFPVVLSSHFGRLHCGARAYAFRSDNCKLGWAYVLAIVSTVLGLYCPLLARFSFVQVYRDAHWATV